MLDLACIRSAMAAYEPHLIDEAGVRHAAVAMLLRPAAPALEVLLIERARRAGDPWSGQMAFPGGRVERSDESLQHAAERETFEEVGIDLAEAELLGRLDDLQGRNAGKAIGLVISAFVYHVRAPAPITSSPEVEDALWVPVASLADPARRVDYRYALAGGARYPGIVVGDPERHIVWGLTYRFVEIFFAALQRPLPNRWPPLA